MAKHHERRFEEIANTEFVEDAFNPVHVAPTEEEVRNLAYWIYQHRLRNGVDGTDRGDWLLAQDILRDLAGWDFGPVP